VSNEVCRLEFSTHLGRTYGVETMDAFGATNSWSNLTSGIVGNGGMMQISDPMTAATRYYRLTVTLSP